MVCIYCGSPTQVTNSRLQKRNNAVWRRRQCTECGAVFSSTERATYETALSVRDRTSHIVPFNRDLLFLSLYDANKHRQSAATDAAALTDTIIHNLLADQKDQQALIDRDRIVQAVIDSLKQFDPAAYSHYRAFHPL